ncbi:MAG: DUF5103 domain-containing protein [Bacteroidia bacterium]|nr:DUF5103 domain-containing protein [Bacteroidia bacterium]
MKKFSLIFAAIGFGLLLNGCPSTSQTLQSDNYSAEKPLVYNDHIYEAAIHTPQLYPLGVEEAYPVIYLGTTTPLVLEFDELIPETAYESNLYVDFISCDAFWQPTGVLPIEFYEGFTQDRIDLYERSTFTKVPYMHYSYIFPQENEYFKLSGNYLLIVYRNGNKNERVLSRRFVVAEKKVSIVPKYLLNDKIERIRMTEFSFDLVVPASLGIFNPANDLTIQVLQNFRWDNAVTLGRPRFAGDNRYEYQLDIARLYNGGNEYRRLDIRSTRFYSEAMQDVVEKENIYDIILFPEKPRDFNIFSTLRDRNGSFKPWVQEWPNAKTQADYVNNHFVLERSEPVPNGEVYVLGKFSDWQMKDDYRLTYNAEARRYEGQIILKQGIYDYGFAVKRPGDPIPDEATLDGRHLETENFYTVIVYYKGPTDRAPKIIGYAPVNYYE